MQAARARYLRGGRVRDAAGGTAARHLGHSIDELRRQAARAGSHAGSARAGERGGTGGRRPPHVAAQVSINRCAASARARRGRGTFMSREQLTAEPRKHESGPLLSSPAPAAPLAPRAWPDLLCAGRCRTRALTPHSVRQNTVEPLF